MQWYGARSGAVRALVGVGGAAVREVGGGAASLVGLACKRAQIANFVDFVDFVGAERLDFIDFVGFVLQLRFTEL